MTSTQTQPVTDLNTAWTEFRQANPNVRIRDAAAQLGVSEAELVALGCGETATRLSADWGELIARLPELGSVMALTRNENAVHERKGEYQNVSINGHMGLVLGEAIDLRLFLSHWHIGFAVEEPSRDGVKRSLQFFDADGTAVHKVFMTEPGRPEAFAELVSAYRAENQSPTQPVLPREARPVERPDSEIDVEGFHAAWRGLQDTHEFFGMLRKFDVARTQALRLAESDFARPVSPAGLRTMLERASERDLPIMVFVGSPGVIQIHTGHVYHIVMHGPWVNVMDPDFNLHVRGDAIASAWIVKKPTTDGHVTSLELFDADGETIALLFGKRKPGQPESEAWRALAAELA